MPPFGAGKATAPGSGWRGGCDATYGGRWDGGRSRARRSWTAKRSRPRKKGPRGFDAGKKTTGRKRQALVDTEGFLTELVVHPANISESAGAKLVLTKAQAAGRRFGKIWVDGGYQAGVVAWAEAELGYLLEVVAHPREATASRCCRGAGWSSAPSPGSAATAG